MASHEKTMAFFSKNCIEILDSVVPSPMAQSIRTRLANADLHHPNISCSFNMWFCLSVLSDPFDQAQNEYLDDDYFLIDFFSFENYFTSNIWPDINLKAIVSHKVLAITQTAWYTSEFSKKKRVVQCYYARLCSS